MQLRVIVFFVFIVRVYGGNIPKVVGGKDVPPGKYPFQVITTYMETFLCGGTILNDRFILTAAHCVAGFNVTFYKVVTGINQQSDNGSVYTADKLIIHENYNASQHLHDIGLVKVKGKIVYSKIVQPVKLPKRFAIYNRKAILIGFGRVGVGKPPATTLQEIELEIFPNFKCKSIIPYVRKTHVCTLTKPGEGACNGDSGGALLWKGKQIGIVSFGVPCAIGAPDVFTRVQSYLTWIKKNVK